MSDESVDCLSAALVCSCRCHRYSLACCFCVESSGANVSIFNQLKSDISVDISVRTQGLTCDLSLVQTCTFFIPHQTQAVCVCVQPQQPLVRSYPAADPLQHAVVSHGQIVKSNPDY